MTSFMLDLSNDSFKSMSNLKVFKSLANVEVIKNHQCKYSIYSIFLASKILIDWLIDRSIDCLIDWWGFTTYIISVQCIRRHVFLLSLGFDYIVKIMAFPAEPRV